MEGRQYEIVCWDMCNDNECSSMHELWEYQARSRSSRGCACNPLFPKHSRAEKWRAAIVCCWPSGGKMTTFHKSLSRYVLQEVELLSLLCLYSSFSLQIRLALFAKVVSQSVSQSVSQYLHRAQRLSAIYQRKKGQFLHMCGEPQKKRSLLT